MVILSDVAKQVQARWRRRVPQQNLPHLILMTDPERLPHPEPIVARLPRGAAIILRHYGMPGRQALARRLAACCRRNGIRLLIADDFRLAVAVRADGVHLPEHRVRSSGRIWSLWRPPGYIITAAAHDRAGLNRASRAGADAVLLSPVFPTTSHPGARVLGPIRFAQLTRHSRLPVYALGGVGGAGARRLVPAQPAGFAAINGIIAP
jgi:thiamine-phosphate pyrophosphorylase